MPNSREKNWTKLRVSVLYLIFIDCPHRIQAGPGTMRQWGTPVFAVWEAVLMIRWREDILSVYVHEAVTGKRRWEGSKLPDGQSETLGGALVLRVLLALFQEPAQEELLQNRSFILPNTLCLVPLLCVLLSARDHTTRCIFFQPAGCCCSEFLGQKSPPYLALLLFRVA